MLWGFEREGLRTTIEFLNLPTGEYELRIVDVDRVERVEHFTNAVDLAKPQQATQDILVGQGWAHTGGWKVNPRADRSQNASGRIFSARSHFRLIVRLRHDHARLRYRDPRHSPTSSPRYNCFSLVTLVAPTMFIFEGSRATRGLSSSIG
jgi:hypothetical protein